ncbi:MAG: tail fiber domain-containing protein, partial [Candidatus Eremiobacterota bacterium]
MPTTFDLGFDTGDVVEALHSRQMGVPLQNVEQGRTWYGAGTWSDGGTTDDYDVTMNSGAVDFAPVLEAGFLVHFKPDAPNNQGPVRINVNGLGLKAVKQKVDQDLAAGDLDAGQMVAVLYDGTNFQLVGGSPAHTHPSSQITDFAEAAQDAVGGMLTDTATIDFIYDDTAGTIAADVKDGSVTYAKLQDVSATDRLLGRATAGSGDVEEIACTAFARSLLDDADAATARGTLSAAAASHTHTLAEGATDVTASAAELNLLDLSGLSTGMVLRATGVSTAAWGAIQGGDLPGHSHGAGDITSGTLGVARGGTGIGSVAAGALLYASAADTWAALAAGSNGQVLKMVSGAPAWAAEGVGGSGSANRVAYWSDASTLTGDDDLQFNGTTLSVGSPTSGSTWTSNGWNKRVELLSGDALKWKLASSYAWGIGASAGQLYIAYSTVDDNSAAAVYMMNLIPSTSQVIFSAVSAGTPFVTLQRDATNGGVLFAFNTGGTSTVEIRNGKCYVNALPNTGTTANMQYTGSATFVYVSCNRALKFDYAPLEISLDALRTLAPQSFTYRDNPGLRRHGFVAEEVAEVHPGLATYRDG